MKGFIHSYDICFGISVTLRFIAHCHIIIMSCHKKKKKNHTAITMTCSSRKRLKEKSKLQSMSVGDVQTHFGRHFGPITSFFDFQPHLAAFTSC